MNTNRSFKPRAPQSNYASENNRSSSDYGGYGDSSRNSRDSRGSSGYNDYRGGYDQRRGGYAGEGGSRPWGSNEVVPSVSNNVKAPSTEDLNNPARFITEGKIHLLNAISITGESSHDILSGIESAFKSKNIKSVYVTPREGRNIIVAAPEGFVVPSSGMVPIRLLSKHSMKKLREM